MINIDELKFDEKGLIPAIVVDAESKKVLTLADLAYHCMVLMVEMGITLDELKGELASRHVIEKKVKQEKMV